METEHNTIVNELEYLQDVTNIHGSVKKLISRDYIFATIPEEKKEPLGKLIAQFYIGYWLKIQASHKDKECSEKEKEQIKTLAEADLKRHLIAYDVYMNLKRNETENPLLELTLTRMKLEKEEEAQPMSTTESLKHMLKLGKKGENE